MSLSDTKNIHICRLCLAQTATFFSLTEATEDSSMLEALTSLKIQPRDEISTVMCLKCRLNLRLAFLIQQNMLQAEEKFRRRRTPLANRVKEEIDDFPNIPGPECSGMEPTQEPACAPYQCDICDKIYSSKKSLRLHKYNVHVKLKCPICGKEITQSNLKRHTERHSEPQTICDICGASMKVQDLRTHMFYKHKEHNYKCNFCEKVFKRKRSRAVHENREHLDIANFVCDTCGKKFYRAYALSKHVQTTHLKLRPYICDFCNVGFSSKFALKTHRRQHTNETPYRCDVCGDGFKQRVSMKTHMKSKHNIEEELTCECKVCGKRFAGKVALVAHSRVH